MVSKVVCVETHNIHNASLCLSKIIIFTVSVTNCQEGFLYYLSPSKDLMKRSPVIKYNIMVHMISHGDVQCNVIQMASVLSFPVHYPSASFHEICFPWERYPYTCIVVEQKSIKCLRPAGTLGFPPPILTAAVKSCHTCWGTHAHTPPSAINTVLDVRARSCAASS